MTGSKLFRQLTEQKANRGTHSCEVSGQQKPSLCHSEGRKKETCQFFEKLKYVVVQPRILYVSKAH